MFECYCLSSLGILEGGCGFSRAGWSSLRDVGQNWFLTPIGCFSLRYSGVCVSLPRKVLFRIFVV